MLYAGPGEPNGRRRSPGFAEAAPSNGAAPDAYLSRVNGTVSHPEELPPPQPAERAPLKAEAHLDASEPERRPIDKSLLAIPEVKRLRDKDHLRFVATHPCIVCGRQPAEAHHLKFSQASALGRKVSDAFTVPLCALHHRDLHTTGHELAWWERKQIDPLVTASSLWDASHGRSEPPQQDPLQPDVTSELG